MRRLHERRVHRRNGAEVRPHERMRLPDSEASRRLGGRRLDADAAVDGPTIVKAKQFAVKPMDVEEAALQMELLGHDFFLFTSTETGRAAVLYRRRDGSLGMIEAAG